MNYVVVLFFITDKSTYKITISGKAPILKTNNKNPSPDECSNIASEVIKYMQLLNTDFVSESFVMYVIEKRKEQPSA